MKRLFLDIETSPNLGYFWRPGWRVNISYENIIEPAQIILVAWKWEHEKTVQLVNWDVSADYNPHADYAPVETVARVVLDADEVVAHNGARFDLAWIRARAAFHAVSFPARVPYVDTCVLARRYFYFPDNRLDSLARYFGLKPKIKVDFDLWKRVKAGDPGALQTMGRYCKHDVALLEKVYGRLQPYIEQSVHAGVASNGERRDCPQCGNTKVVPHRRRWTKLGMPRIQMRCPQCFSYYTVTERVADLGSVVIADSTEEDKKQCRR